MSSPLGLSEVAEGASSESLEKSSSSEDFSFLHFEVTHELQGCGVLVFVVFTDRHARSGDPACIVPPEHFRRPRPGVRARDTMRRNCLRRPAALQPIVVVLRAQSASL